jgi:hypothetical protein
MPGGWDEQEAAIVSEKNEYRPISHATIVTKRADRRIMGGSGVRVNLCGAAPTIYDVLIRNFQRLAHPCPECARLVSNLNHASRFGAGTRYSK